MISSKPDIVYVLHKYALIMIMIMIITYCYYYYYWYYHYSLLCQGHFEQEIIIKIVFWSP